MPCSKDPARGAVSEVPAEEVDRFVHLHQSLGVGALEDHGKYASALEAAARGGGGAREEL